MVLLGVTGGIGMGKSVSSAILGDLGIPFADTDVLAREVAPPGSRAVEEISRQFGSAVVDERGELRRDRLAAIVFSDREARRRLEEIMHPRIFAVWQGRVAEWKSQGVRMAAVVIPLLYEKHYEREFSRVICLACTASTQQQRLRERSWSEQQIQERNAAQLPVGDKMARADFVIWTEGSQEAHRHQWERILGVVASSTCSPV